MSVEQIAAGLQDSYALLGRGRRNAPTRQQSLSCCIEWSYNLCSQYEQQVWGRLSVFAGSFDLPAARYVSGDDLPPGEFLDLMCALVDKSILIRTEQQGVVCFRLLETLRDYAQSRTAEDERLRFSQRHVDWYHQLVSESEAEWYGPEQVRWVRRLARELPNIREALQFSPFTDSPANAVDVTTALRRFWVYHAVVSEGLQWATRALDAMPPEPSAQRIQALFTAAHLSRRHGDPVTAETWIGQARELLKEVDDPVTRGRISFSDGYIAVLSGNAESARDSLQQAMATTDDFETQLYSMSALSWLDLISDDAAGALASSKVLALAESRGDWAIRAVTLGSVGAAHWRLGQLDLAEQALRQGLQLALEVKDIYAVANGIENLGVDNGNPGPTPASSDLMAAAAGISAANGAVLASFFLGGIHAECELRLREQLGEEDFQTAWKEGTMLEMSHVAEAVGLDG